MLIARNNTTHFLNALKLITVPPGKGIEVAATKQEHVLAHGAAVGQMTWITQFQKSSDEDSADKAVEIWLAGPLPPLACILRWHRVF